MNPEDQRELAEARETIAAQASELARLRAAAGDAAPFIAFRDALELAATANAVLPETTHRKLLRLIVETAAAVLDAESASLFLIDEETDELIFEVALGQDESEVRKWRLAPGVGIAGLVAATGQPMAITGVQDDPRHAADVAARMGRQPRSLLCVPLFLGTESIGVLEMLDKRGEPGFGAADIATIGHFAAEAALAISLSRSQQTVLGLLREAARAGDTAAAVASLLEDAPEMQRTLELAGLVRNLAERGEAEAELAAAILRAVSGYAGRRR